ncbi:hypothetical protein HZ326_13009 [Fusarium oxysporum f. sp. albedinis]|nr:hypothetical protein HZ326_13009 [Fusarium oxysporum f. sp. albedinis]
MQSLIHIRLTGISSRANRCFFPELLNVTLVNHPRWVSCKRRRSLQTVQEPESFNPRLPALRQGPLAINWPPFDLRKSTLYMGPAMVRKSRSPRSPKLTKPTMQQGIFS